MCMGWWMEVKPARACYNIPCLQRKIGNLQICWGLLLAIISFKENKLWNTSANLDSDVMIFETLRWLSSPREITMEDLLWRRKAMYWAQQLPSSRIFRLHNIAWMQQICISMWSVVKRFCCCAFGMDIMSIWTVALSQITKSGPTRYWIYAPELFIYPWYEYNRVTLVNAL